MNPLGIEAATHRLHALALDTQTENAREKRRLTHQENSDLTAILDEVHRLHVAISTEVREHRETRERAKKSRANRLRSHDHKPGRPAAPGKKARP